MRKERRDAVKLKVDGLHTIFPYIMPSRAAAEVSMQDVFDISDLNAYMKKRNEEEGTKLKLFHAICTAVAKTVYWRPKLNIFVSGNRFWQRKDIILAFVVKRTFEDTSEESLMFLKVKPDMTLDTISRKILGEVHELRENSGKNDIGDMINIFAKIPHFLLRIIFKILRMLEYCGRMPKAFSDGDTNYATVLLSNLGSIKCGSVYHHLNDYGTNSIVATIGTAHKALVYEDDGMEHVHDVVDMQLTLDERIADGFYFARSLKLVNYLLEHPEELEAPIGNELSAGAIEALGGKL